MLQDLRTLLAIGLVTNALVLAPESVFAQPPADPPPGAQEPVEESPLLREPETPEEQFEAALLMIRLARPRLARLYLQQFVDSNPDDDLLLQLRDRHGPASFLRLANTPELRPLSTNLLDRANEAFRRRGADPSRLDALIDQLRGTPAEREVAIIALRSAGPIVVPRMLERMMAPNDPVSRETLIYGLSRMDVQILSAMVGALETPHDNLRASVLQILGYLRSTDAVPHLYFWAYGPSSSPGVRVAARAALGEILATSAGSGRVDRTTGTGVAAELKRLAYLHLRNEFGWEINTDGTLEHWSWDRQANTVRAASVTPQVASLLTGAKFARQALLMSPESSELQALVLLFELTKSLEFSPEPGVLPVGPGTPHNLAVASGEAAATETLEIALAHRQSTGAIAALQVLSQVGTHNLLFGSAGGRTVSPLIAALNYPDEQVQFAAASTILQIDPQRTFRGADRVVQILSRALRDSGDPAALVVHPNSATANSLGGLVAQLGYGVHTAATGREAFEAAASRNDISFIMLDINTIRWDLSQTVANFRADARTAAKPIIVFGPESMRSRVDVLISRNQPMTYIVETSTVDNLRIQLQPFLDSVRTPQLTPEQRAARTEAAAYWLAHIANGQRTSIFPIAAAEEALRDVLADPALFSNALQALAVIPSQGVQEHFSQIAAGPQMAVEMRTAAAVQLAFHIQRFGLLISDKQVLDLEIAAKAEADVGLATALAGVVGSLRPDEKRIGERINRFFEPPVEEPPADGAPTP